jgi:hypothetical protein
MESRTVIARILAIAGTVPVWLPLLAPLVFAVRSLIGRQGFRFDYFMPAELSPAILAGGALLVVSAVLARSRRRLVIASLAAAVVLLVGSQVFAVVTGLASGRTEATGWRWGITFAGIIGYALAAAALGVGGVLLIRDLFRSTQTAA